MTDSFNLPETTSTIPGDATPATAANSVTVDSTTPTPTSTPKTSINMHPKVFTALLIGLALTVVSGTASVLTPDVFTALGPWEAPAFALATTGLSVLGAWLKGVKSREDSGE